jgi:hypothetical protein
MARLRRYYTPVEIGSLEVLTVMLRTFGFNCNYVRLFRVSARILYPLLHINARY